MRSAIEITAEGDLVRTPPLIEASDVATIPTTHAIPRANHNGHIDAGWIPPDARTILVREQDGDPSVTVTTIVVGNGDLTYQGDGIARIRTASDATVNALTIRDIDGSSSISPVTVIECPSVTDMGGGVARINTGTGTGAITIRDTNGNPNASASVIVVGSGDAINEGNGVIRIRTASDTTSDTTSEKSAQMLFLWMNFR